MTGFEFVDTATLGWPQNYPRCRLSDEILSLLTLPLYLHTASLLSSRLSMFSGRCRTVHPKSFSVDGWYPATPGQIRSRQILPTPAPTPTPGEAVDSDRLKLRPQLRLRSPRAALPSCDHVKLFCRNMMIPRCPESTPSYWFHFLHIWSLKTSFDSDSTSDVSLHRESQVSSQVQSDQ